MPSNTGSPRVSDLMHQLVTSLTSSGTRTAPDAGGRGLLVTAVAGRARTPAVRVRVTEADLQQFVRRNASSCAPVFPDVTPDVAAFRVLLVNVDEALTSGGTDVVVADGKVHWTSPPPWSWLESADVDAIAGADPADLTWSAHPADRER